MTVIAELRWRDMIHDLTPGTEKQLAKEPTTLYLGIDPTADSLHIGHLASIMLLKHFQLHGHKPLVLVGGATGMIGDPSGKSQERNLLDYDTIKHNQEELQKQLSRFIDFGNKANSAELVNNYDWISQFSFVEFIRDVGKHITINYMMAKDSVKKRLDSGLSFTEFTYQLVQGYDFYYLYKTKNCKLQIGGADQWGNITTGTELIRRKAGGEAFALTTPLITRADGGKFGKTEEGNVWLSSKYTSPFKFYQFWLNVSDEEAKKYIKVFSLLPQHRVQEIIEEHDKAPHLRMLQKELAKETTIMVHSTEAYNKAEEATNILFGNATLESLQNLDESTFLQIFEGVAVFHIDRNDLRRTIPVISLLAEKTSIFLSKSEARRTLAGGGISINKMRINNPEQTIDENHLLNNKYLLVQKGKKIYFLINVK